MGSRGSVIPFFLKKRAEGLIPITDLRMTRFNITLEEGVDLVLFALENMWGGEIFVPKIPSYRIADMAEAIAPGCDIDIVGIRPGEKLHEDLIPETDAHHTVEFDNYYAILPTTTRIDVSGFITNFRGRMCPDGFRYCSGTNTEWLTVEQIRNLIVEYIDPKFTPAEFAELRSKLKLTLRRQAESTAGERSRTVDRVVKLPDKIEVG
jgi:FlaA1/EpsC-like NDP-sugar epimerase